MRVEKLRWGDEVPAELLPVLPFGHVLAAEVVYLAEAVQPLLSSMKALSGGERHERSRHPSRQLVLAAPH